ncbi:MAG: flippase [Polymorphobacter sp.]
MTAVPDPRWRKLIPRPVRERLLSRPLLARLVANIGWLVGDRLVRMGIGLVLGAWTARYLGPDQFGALNYAMAMVALYAAIATMGIPDVLVRDMVHHPERRRTLMASAFVLRLGGGVLTIMLAAATVAVLNPGGSAAVGLVLIIAVGPLAQAFDVIDTRYQAVNEVRAIVVLRNIAFLLVSGLRIAAILAQAPLPVFAALTSIEAVIAGGLMWWRARRSGRDFGIADVSARECRHLLVASWPLLLRLLAIGLYMRIDQVLIGRLLGDRSVGLYAAAARVSELWYIVPAVVMTALVPRLAESHKKSIAEYEAMLVQVMRPLVWAAIGFAALLSLSAPLVIHLLFGVHFAAAAPVLALHAWAGVMVTLGVASTAWFVNMGHMRYGLLQALIGGVISVAANLILIPRYGINGAALTVIISQFASAVAVNAVFPATRPIFMMQMRALWPAFARRRPRAD